jgi:hypothetical protein
MKFKKGDKVRLKKYPEAKGVVSNPTERMIWCMINETTKVPFGEPNSVELDVVETI